MSSSICMCTWAFRTYPQPLELWKKHCQLCLTNFIPCSCLYLFLIHRCLPSIAHHNKPSPSLYRAAFIHVLSNPFGQRQFCCLPFTALCSRIQKRQPGYVNIIPIPHVRFCCTPLLRECQEDCATLWNARECWACRIDLTMYGCRRWRYLGIVWMCRMKYLELMRCDFVCIRDDATHTRNHGIHFKAREKDWDSSVGANANGVCDLRDTMDECNWASGSPPLNPTDVHYFWCDWTKFHERLRHRNRSDSWRRGGDAGNDYRHGVSKSIVAQLTFVFIQEVVNDKPSPHSWWQIF